MPQGEDLYQLRRLLHPIVEVIVNPTEVDTAYACKLGIAGFGADLWLHGDEFQGVRDLLTKDPRSFRTIGIPPRRRL